MILVIGLGNPGEKYQKTRHNVGWIIFDSLLVNADWDKSSKAKTLYYHNLIGEKEVEYLKPQTFMNESGFSVSYAQKKHGVESENIIVIHDDIDLPVGKIKVSYDRGDGGHNGVKSIMDHLGSQSFIRIRIGVSILDENEVLRKPNVLGNFSKEELETINKDVAPTVAKILEIIVTKGKESAMNKFNQ